MDNAAATASPAATHLFMRPYNALRDKLRFETDQKKVDFAESFIGKYLITISFTVLISQVTLPFGGLSVPMALAAAACAYSGKYRHWVMPLMTLGMLCAYTWFADDLLTEHVIAREGLKDTIDTQLLRYVSLIAFMLFASGAIYCTRRFKERAPFRRPLFSLFLFFFALLFFADSGALHGLPQVLLWSFVSMLGSFFCFLGYALLDQQTKNPSPLPFQLGTFYPFWGSSWVPLGKGAAYLRKVEVKTSRELAVLQLQAMRLLMWSYFLQIVNTQYRHILYDYFYIPVLEDIFVSQAVGDPYPWYICWISLMSVFFGLILTVTATTGVAVACAQLAGFKILPSIQNPLQSRTIAEFYNRYSFYIKELFTEFFFYPTFLRFFKNYKRLRIFFATMMAAGAGNVLLHFISCIELVESVGLKKAVIDFESYALYAVILATGIAASQVSSRKHTPAHGFRGRIVPFIRITLFFCLLRVLEVGYGKNMYSLQERIYFLLHLFGLH